jgi:hypothetical protein
MKRYRLQLIAFLIFACGATFLPFVASAYYSDDADATDASYESGTLAIDIDDAAIAATIMGTGTTTPDSFVVSSLGSLEPQYRITATKGTCEPSFYDGITVAVTQGSVVYAGPLSALSATSSDEGEWSFEFSTNGVTAQVNDTCELTLTLSAWQENLLSNTHGFTDEKTIDVTLTAGEDIGQQPTGNVVLNEIYPNEDNAASAPLNQEWVELYNGTDAPVDIEGWSLGELSGVVEDTHVISASNTCAPSMQDGYARPYHGASTVIPPKGLLIVEFCAQNRMNNNGDTITLYDTTNTAVDSHVYPNTAKGKSNARFPDGSVWVDPVPTPGEPNVATEAELEAAGWTTDEIDAVLGTEGVTHDTDTHSSSGSGQAEEPAVANTEEPTTDQKQNTDEETVSAPPDTPPEEEVTDPETPDQPVVTPDEQKIEDAPQETTGQTEAENDSTGTNI